MSCTDELGCLNNDLICKIKDISCKINSYESIGRPVVKLWKGLVKVQNIKWVIDHSYCPLTCEEVEKFRCIVKKIKG